MRTAFSTVVPGYSDLIDKWKVTFFRRFSPALVFSAFLASFLAWFRSRAALQMEILALRHQLGVLQRSVKRPKLTAADRRFWAWLSQAWSNWREAMVIVRPETVIAARAAVCNSASAPQASSSMSRPFGRLVKILVGH